MAAAVTWQARVLEWSNRQDQVVDPQPPKQLPAALVDVANVVRNCASFRFPFNVSSWYSRFVPFISSSTDNLEKLAAKVACSRRSRTSPAAASWGGLPGSRRQQLP